MVRFRNADALSADDRIREMDRVSPVRQLETRAIPPSMPTRSARARWAPIRTASRRFRSLPSRAAGGIPRRPQRPIDELAVLFLIVRIAYVLTYLGDRPTLRSILWEPRLCDQSGDFLHAADPRLLADVDYSTSPALRRGSRARGRRQQQHQPARRIPRRA